MESTLWLKGRKAGQFVASLWGSRGPLTSWDFNDTAEGALEHSVLVTAPSVAFVLQERNARHSAQTVAVEIDKSHGNYSSVPASLVEKTLRLSLTELSGALHCTRGGWIVQWTLLCLAARPLMNNDSHTQAGPDHNAERTVYNETRPISGARAAERNIGSTNGVILSKANKKWRYAIPLDSRSV